jgi:hypothetical protein
MMNKRHPRLLPIIQTRKTQVRNSWLQGGWLLSIITLFVNTSVLADTANFGTISLSPGSDILTSSVSGYTGGSYSLSAIANRDTNSKVCVGFADPNPDYIVVLEKDFSNLKLLVNSGGTDTTMLIKAPDNTIYCGDDTGKNKDASIDFKKLKAGNYKVWIGTFNSNVKQNYTLTVQQ